MLVEAICMDEDEAWLAVETPEESELAEEEEVEETGEATEEVGEEAAEW